NYETRASLVTNKDAASILARIGFSTQDVNSRDAWGGGGAHFLAAITADSWVRYSIDLRKRYGTRLFLATAFPGEQPRFLEAIDRHADKLHLDTLRV
ncbi:MAG TPA: hypothetical protein VLA24_12790, partial [Pseudomonadales bacterium]|nr:hypothetical protein [Pseudomonadales bacterium]